MGGENLPDDGHADTGAEGFCRKERLEDIDLGRIPAPLSVTSKITSALPADPLNKRLPPCRHRLHGVLGQVQNHLFDLVDIDA